MCNESTLLYFIYSEPDRYIGLLISFADIGVSQICQYQSICSPIRASIKTVFKAKKMLGLVISNGVNM